MVEKDIAFLGSQGGKVCPDVLYTGQPSDVALSRQLEVMSNSNPQVIKEIVFTAHGTPGRNGIIGMKYRMGALELVEILRSLGIEALCEHRLHFYFRCCNSAYAAIDCQKKAPEAASAAILEQSFIAGFYEIMKKLGCSNLSVTGFSRILFPCGQKTGVVDRRGQDQTTYRRRNRDHRRRWRRAHLREHLETQEHEGSE